MNEPNGNQIENVIVILDQKNYNTTIGNILEYRMATKRTVEPGEEITWSSFINFCCFKANYYITGVMVTII